jgi:hypothetical protein
VEKRVSYYLAPRHDDFSEVPKDVFRSGSFEILYAVPANDNLASNAIRSFNCLNLIRRLSQFIALLYTEAFSDSDQL